MLLIYLLRYEDINLLYVADSLMYPLFVYFVPVCVCVCVCVRGVYLRIYFLCAYACVHAQATEAQILGAIKLGTEAEPVHMTHIFNVQTFHHRDMGK